MKQQFKMYLPLFLLGGFLFLGITYWSTFIQFLGKGWSAATPLILGFVFAYLLNILMVQCEKGLDKVTHQAIEPHKRRVLALLFSFTMVILVMILFIRIVVPELVTCIQTLIHYDPQNLELIFKRLEDYPFLTDIFRQLQVSLSENQSQIQEKLIQFAQGLFVGVGGVLFSFVTTLTNLFSAIVTVVIGLIFMIYLLLGKNTLIRQLKTLIHVYFDAYEARIIYLGQVTHSCFKNFIVGQITEAVILGSLCFLGMLVFRFPYAATISVLMGVLALIPIVGAYISLVIGFIMILTQSPLQALLFILYIIVLQQIEGNLIYPKVVGNSIGLPGIWVLAAVTIAGSLWGIIGMLISVPITAIVYRLLSEYIHKKLSKEKESLNENSSINA